jgi:hypothetical protein
MPTPLEINITSLFAPPRNATSTTPEPVKNLREKDADSFHAALGGVLARGIADALAAGDHDRAVGLINRGFAEGTPELGCDLLRQAMAIVGTSRTWTVQIAPLSGRRSPA